MSLDIVGALEAIPKPGLADGCKLGRWYDAIPDDNPGKTALGQIMTETDQASPNWRTLEQIDSVLRRLGISSSNKTIGNHRMGRCRCFT